MKLILKIRGMIHNELQTVILDDMTSPNDGYTQKYADEMGRSYVEQRADEQFGDHDFWEFESAKYMTDAEYYA